MKFDKTYLPVLKYLNSKTRHLLVSFQNNTDVSLNFKFLIHKKSRKCLQKTGKFTNNVRMTKEMGFFNCVLNFNKSFVMFLMKLFSMNLRNWLNKFTFFLLFLIDTNSFVSQICKSNSKRFKIAENSRKNCNRSLFCEGENG